MGGAGTARRVECREAVTLDGHVGKIGCRRWISRIGSGSLGDLLPNALGLVCHRSFPKSRSLRRIRKDFLLIYSIMTSSKNSFLVRRPLRDINPVSDWTRMLGSESGVWNPSQSKRMDLALIRLSLTELRETGRESLAYFLNNN